MSGVCAGIITASLTNPIWLVKTRIQLQMNLKNDKNVVGDSMKLSSLSTPVSHSKVSISNPVTSKSSPLISSKSSSNYFPQNSRHPLKNHSTHASASYSSHLYANTPSSASPPPYKNSIDCAIRIVREEGVRGLFRGLSASYLGIFESTAQWIIYEHLKKAIAIRRHDGQLAVSDSFLAAACSKLCASLGTYPHEVLRTRLRQVVSETRQTLQNGKMIEIIHSVPRYRNILDVVRTVVRQEGVLALYGGMAAHLLKTVPNAAIMFCCYGKRLLLYAHSHSIAFRNNCTIFSRGCIIN